MSPDQPRKKAGRVQATKRRRGMSSEQARVSALKTWAKHRDTMLRAIQNGHRRRKQYTVTISRVGQFRSRNPTVERYPQNISYFVPDEHLLIGRLGIQVFEYPQ